MPVLTTIGLIVVAALILANGYFVAAEFAFVAARRSRLEADAPEDRRSARAVEVQRRLSFMLSGAQLGITVTSLVVGFVAEPTLGRALEPVAGAVGIPSGVRGGVALVVGFVLATIGQMVLGELAPKNLAIARPEPVARALAPSTWTFLRLAAPFIRVFDGSANWLLRKVGIEPVEEHHGAVSVAELPLIVEESADEGELTRQQAALLERALDFGELRAASAMVPWNKVTTVLDTASGEDLRAVMASSGHSRFPVVTADGDVTAVVHAKDLLAVPAETLAEVSAGKLARPVPVVPEAAGLRAVLGQLRGEATELALVVDEYGAPAGAITLEDLVEELVGDIADEHDPDEPRPRRDSETGAWLVPGDWRPDEIERATGLVLPQDEHGDYDTVAGLVLARLQRLARSGDRVEVDGVAIDVVAVQDRTITDVRLELAVEEGDGDTAADEGGASS